MGFPLFTLVRVGLCWLAYDANRRRAAGETYSAGYRTLLWAATGRPALVALAAAGISVFVLASVNRGFGGVALSFLPVICIVAVLLALLFASFARYRPQPSDANGG